MYQYYHNIFEKREQDYRLSLGKRKKNKNIKKDELIDQLYGLTNENNKISFTI
jgi:hypothetical protein